MKKTPSNKVRVPVLPPLLHRKIYKTGQTRGAEDDEIYQNRVGRSSTVIIPYSSFDVWKNSPDNGGIYEKGFIVIIKPKFYFDHDIKADLEAKGLEIGINALLFYETRYDWVKYNPEELNLQPATSRLAPLGGEYVARVPGTTSDDNNKILRGYTSNKLKGAGIRVYEYASRETCIKSSYQLEYIYWQCKDARETSIQAGMSPTDVEQRITHITNIVDELSLNDTKTLVESRILDRKGNTICPLCLENLSAIGFISRLAQAEGREVPDLTVTQINLFHIRELRNGEFNHRPYNLGWGHHHCNTVVKDDGIRKTVDWMSTVVKRNEEYDDYQAKIGI